MRMQIVILTSVQEVYEQVATKLKIYFGLTAICFGLDNVDLWIQGLRFGVPGDEYSDILLVFACLMMLGIDLFYPAWVWLMDGKLPKLMQEHTAQAMFGFGSKFKQHVGKNLVLVKSGAIKAKDGAKKGFKAAYGLNKAKKREVDEQKRPPQGDQVIGREVVM